MRKSIRTIATFSLSLSMIFPLVACKKKSDSSDKITSDDPYFSVKMSEIMPILAEGKELEEKWLIDSKIIGDTFIADYRVNYVIPEEVIRSFEDPNADYFELSRILDSYQERCVGIFNLDGQPIAKLETPQGAQMMGATVKQDGDILVMIFKSEENKTELYTYSSTGELKNSKSIEGLGNDSVEEIIPLEDGSMLVQDLVRNIARYDANGTITKTYSPRNQSEKLLQINGKYYITSREETASYIQEFDIQSLSLVGNKQQITVEFNGTVSDSNNSTYMVGANGIKKVDLLANSSEIYMDWNYTNVNQNYLKDADFSIVSDDKLVFVGNIDRRDLLDNDPFKYQPVVWTFVREKENPNVGKSKIQIGTYGEVSDSLMDYIVDYNSKAENKAVAYLHDYSAEIVQDSKKDQAITEMTDKLYLEILDGKGPDILLNFASFSKFASDKALVDLNTFIDGANGLKRDQYFDNIFRSFEIDGKLYQMPISFDITGLLADQKVVGSRTGWNYSDFRAVVEELPQETSVFGYTLYDDLLLNLLTQGSSSFIDYHTKEVHLNGDDFKQVLNMTKEYGVQTIPESTSLVSLDCPYEEDELADLIACPDGRQYDDIYSIDGQNLELMKNGALASQKVSIWNLNRFVQLKSYFDGNGIIIGMPSPNGSTVSCSPRISLAISAASKYKEEAWDFIAHFLDEETQYNIARTTNSIPLQRQALSRMNVDVIAQNKEDQEDTAYMWELPFTLVPILDGDEKEFVSLIESIQTTSIVDRDVMSIIQEEAAAFFADQKDLDTVCKNIQDRATKVVQER